MSDWRDTLVREDATLREVLTCIDDSGLQIALVVDGEGRLAGTMTDGDARRAILAGQELDAAVAGMMQRSPTCARPGDSRADVLQTMREKKLLRIPKVEDDGRVVGLSTIGDFLRAEARDEWVVVMAGGLGSRLQELTEDTPKPMLPVGGRPILDTILQGLMDQGFSRFYLAVNFKADVIESYFGDGSEMGARIEYLREEQRMGTAGALSLLPERPERPVLLTNADLLTKVDCAGLMDAHHATGAAATMAVREYEMRVPFGVVVEEQGVITEIREKPVIRSIVNAGIYVLSPEVLDLVPGGSYLDVPSLFERAMGAGLVARSHRVDGYWMDIGRIHDFSRANADYRQVFK